MLPCELGIIEISKTINPNDRVPQNPFRQQHYLLRYLAIGGKFGGAPSKITFPSKYEIEHVQVYQSK